MGARAVLALVLAALAAGCGQTHGLGEDASLVDASAPLDTGAPLDGAVARDAPSRDAPVHDVDGDGSRAQHLGGDDCDDRDPRRYPGNVEICDAEWLDEDCDPDTFGARDGDGDEFFDAACCNTTDRGERVCGDDCDDTDARVSPDELEVEGDGIDNDCDGTAS